MLTSAQHLWKITQAKIMQDTNFERILVRRKIQLTFHSCFLLLKCYLLLFLSERKDGGNMPRDKKMMGRLCSWRNNFKCPHMVYFFSCNFLPSKQQWSWNLTQKKKCPLYIYHYVHNSSSTFSVRKSKSKKKWALS